MAVISQYQTVSDGQVLTASLWNGMENHLINDGLIPTGIEDASSNDAAMQTGVDPFPGGAISRPTDLAGELHRIRYQILQLVKLFDSTKTYWYEDPSISNSDVIDTDQIVNDAITQDKIADNAVGNDQLADDAVNTDEIVDGAITAAKLNSSFYSELTNSIVNYRVPNLIYAAPTGDAFIVENNTGTLHQTKILFPDGSIRSVTEDIGSTSKYRKCLVTEFAEFTSGTENSGLYSGQSRASWYYVYAVKSLINANNFVLVADTTLYPAQTNYSALNTRYGASGWVYLGAILDSTTIVIDDFVMNGNEVIIRDGSIIATGSGTSLNYDGSGWPATAKYMKYQIEVAISGNVVSSNHHVRILTKRQSIVMPISYYDGANTKAFVTFGPVPQGSFTVNVSASASINIYRSGYIDSIKSLSLTPTI